MPRKTDGIEFEIHPRPTKGQDVFSHRRALQLAHLSSCAEVFRHVACCDGEG